MKNHRGFQGYNPFHCEQADICQILFDIVEDQSDVHGRAVKETAISGHPQSDQLRSGKPDGEPGTHITTTISDRVRW